MMAQKTKMNAWTVLFATGLPIQTISCTRIIVLCCPQVSHLNDSLQEWLSLAIVNRDDPNYFRK